MSDDHDHDHDNHVDKIDIDDYISKLNRYYILRMHQEYERKRKYNLEIK